MVVVVGAARHAAPHHYDRSALFLAEDGHMALKSKVKTPGAKPRHGKQEEDTTPPPKKSEVIICIDTEWTLYVPETKAPARS